MPWKEIRRPNWADIVCQEFASEFKPMPSQMEYTTEKVWVEPEYATSYDLGYNAVIRQEIVDLYRFMANKLDIKLEKKAMVKRVIRD
jgi:glycine cleavage system H lipoate-binding protein